MDHLSKEAYVTKIPSEVRGVLSGEMSNAAVLVVADLQGHAPQADLERAVCDTMAAMPHAAKLLLFTDVPPGRHKAEKSVQMQVDAADQAPEDESDCESEEQVSEQPLPVVRAEGNVRLMTLTQKQRMLAEHRKLLSKQLSETFGDGVNQHFELPFTLLFNSPMQGRLTMDGLLVQPIKGLGRTTPPPGWAPGRPTSGRSIPCPTKTRPPSCRSAGLPRHGGHHVRPDPELRHDWPHPT